MVLNYAPLLHCPQPEAVDSRVAMCSDGGCLSGEVCSDSVQR